jgi:hypothetical protein
MKVLMNIWMVQVIPLSINAEYSSVTTLLIIRSLSTTRYKRILHEKKARDEERRCGILST